MSPGNFPNHEKNGLKNKDIAPAVININPIIISILENEFIIKSPQYLLHYLFD